MKLYDTKTGTEVANILTNHSMSIDEILDFMGITVDCEQGGQLIDSDGHDLDAWYDDLDMAW